MPSHRDEEFDAFVTTDSARLSRLSWVLAGADGAADDLLQEALLRTYSRWSSIVQRDVDPYQYARRTMLNLTTDSWRSRVRRRRAEARWASELATTERSDPPTPQVAAAELVARLTAHQRRVISCRYLEDMSVRQTATELAITENNVKVTTNRALAALRGALTLEESHD